MKRSGRVLILTAAAILAAWVLPVSNAYAVLLTSPVVAESGEAVANTSIQIFQDGNKIGEEKTDDRGMLGFVFPGYTGYQPLDILRGGDIPPNYGEEPVEATPVPTGAQLYLLAVTAHQLQLYLELASPTAADAAIWQARLTA